MHRSFNPKKWKSTSATEKVTAMPKWLAATAALILMFVIPSPALAQDGPELTTEQTEAIAVLQIEVATVNLLKADGLITDRAAGEAVDKFLGQAALVDLTIADVASLNAYEVDLAQGQPLTWGQKAIGALTFVNFIWTVAICLGAVFLVMFLMALAPLFGLIPKTFWELCVYGLAIGTGVGASFVAPAVVGYVALTSGVLFAAAIALTVALHNFDSEDGMSFLFFGHALICTALGVFYGGQLVAALAVCSFMAAAGFSVFIGPLSYAFGFKDEEALGRSTTAAFLLLAPFMVANVFMADLPQMATFAPGVLHLCSFVGLLGLLIKAFEFYSNGSRYIVSNVLFIAAAVGMVALGSMFDMPEMQKYAGTFFVIYILTKLIDIPADSVLGYSFLGLVGCGAASAGAWYVNLHVDLFAPYLFGL